MLGVFWIALGFRHPSSNSSKSCGASCSRLTSVVGAMLGQFGAEMREVRAMSFRGATTGPGEITGPSGVEPRRCCWPPLGAARLLSLGRPLQVHDLVALLVSGAGLFR